MAKSISFLSAFLRIKTVRTNRHFRSGNPIFDCRIFTNGTMALLLLSLSFFSCNDRNVQHKSETEIWLDKCSTFVSDLTTRTDASTKDLTEMVSTWQGLSDSLRHHITETDSTTINGFRNLCDSINHIVARLVDSRPRTFSDYLSILDATQDFDVDSTSLQTINAIHTMYEKAEVIPVYKDSPCKVLQRYEKLLDRNLASGDLSPKSLATFLKSEDVAFRSFLSNLALMGDSPLDSIAAKSRRISLRIFFMADSSGALSKADVVIILLMRQNRRILQNAVQCVADIHSGKIVNPAQKTAYLWMLLQPWETIDRFAYSLLDDTEKASLAELGRNTPDIVNALFGSGMTAEIEMLPALLIKNILAANDTLI